MISDCALNPQHYFHALQAFAQAWAVGWNLAFVCVCVCVCVGVVCVVCAFFLCVGVVCGVFLLGGGKAVVGDGSPWESLLVCAR